MLDFFVPLTPLRRGPASSFFKNENNGREELLFRGQGNSTERQRRGRNEPARSYHARARIMTNGETLPRGGQPSCSPFCCPAQQRGH